MRRPLSVLSVVIGVLFIVLIGVLLNGLAGRGPFAALAGLTDKSRTVTPGAPTAVRGQARSATPMAAEPPTGCPSSLQASCAEGGPCLHCPDVCPIPPCPWTSECQGDGYDSIECEAAQVSVCAGCTAGALGDHQNSYCGCDFECIQCRCSTCNDGNPGYWSSCRCVSQERIQSGQLVSVGCCTPRTCPDRWLDENGHFDIHDFLKGSAEIGDPPGSSGGTC